MKKQFQQLLAIGSIAIAAFGAVSTANAFPLTLTAAGTGLGFTLSTVVSSLSGGTPNCCHVLGSAVNSAGQIIVNNAGNSTNYLFANVDNQVGPGAAISSTPAFGFPIAMANAGGNVYAGGGNLRKLNNDGSVAATYSDINISLGMWTNTVNQHLIAVGSFSGGSGLIDIDVSGALPSVRLINGAFSDGLTVSPDGTIVYTNDAAYRISDGVLLASYFVPGADGMGVITSGNALNGDIIVSTTGGKLVLLDPLLGFAQTVIADFGGYGDFTSPDFTTGTLLVSSGDYLMRLGCGQGCGVGSAPPPGVPEPSALWLAALGLLGLARVRMTRRAKV